MARNFVIRCISKARGNFSPEGPRESVNKRIGVTEKEKSRESLTGSKPKRHQQITRPITTVQSIVVVQKTHSVELESEEEAESEDAVPPKALYMPR